MNFLLFKKLVDKYGLKVQANSSTKIKEVLDKLRIPAAIYMRDDQFTTASGIVNLHPIKETHWDLFVDDCYFGYGCQPPVNVLNQI